MVIKTFECDNCNEKYDMEMDMNVKEADCPKCGKPMARVFNNISIARPGADSKGFYGIDKDKK